MNVLKWIAALLFVYGLGAMVGVYAWMYGNWPGLACWVAGYTAAMMADRVVSPWVKRRNANKPIIDAEWEPLYSPCLGCGVTCRSGDQLCNDCLKAEVAAWERGLAEQVRLAKQHGE